MAVPAELRALTAIKRLQSLSPAEFETLMNEEMGNSVLGMLTALAHSLYPEADPSTTARQVHLLVTGYLLGRSLASNSRE